MTDEHHIKTKALVKKYLEGNCTEQEKAWIEQWYFALNDSPNELTDEVVATDLLELQHRLSNITHKKIKLTPYIQAAAAVVLVCLAMGGVLWHSNTKDNLHKSAVVVKKDILPGSNRAVLSLDGGKGIVLSEEKDRLVTDGNSIAYNDGTAIQKVDKVQMATLTTPIAGQYQVILPDGTHAWLNAKSSITYPTRFSEGGKREISVSGEVYLDVAKDPKRPFVVHTGQQQIEVLGTSFNINAYGDNGQTLTTLAEGSLRVINTRYKSNTLLVPGQQAVVSNTKDIKVQAVDIDESASWKYGLFIINDKPLSSYALQLARWYDVEVDVQSYGNTRFSAIIPRNAKLSEVLQAIELKTGVKFQMEGRRVTAIK